MTQHRKPIIWCIGGIDPSSGAGLTQDSKVAHLYGIHSCCIVTANTVQDDESFISLNPTDDKIFLQQFNLLKKSHPPCVIKSGVLATNRQIITLADYLEKHPQVKYICDPVLSSTTGGSCLSDELLELMVIRLLPQAYLFTPNIPEAATFMKDDLIEQESNLSHLAKAISQHFSIDHVLIKGGHVNHQKKIDWFYNHKEQMHLHYQYETQSSVNPRGTGCALATSVACLVAKLMPLNEAIYLAKSQISYEISHPYFAGTKALLNYTKLLNWQALITYAPKVLNTTKRLPLFPKLLVPLGLYVIVDGSDWVERLAKLNVKTIQLRIKDRTQEALEQEVKRSAAIAKKYKLNLFINDYWQLAIKYQCFGVHLGQEDLQLANMHKIAQAGLHLGVSTHNHVELAFALSFSPSYVALGAIYPTTTKALKYPEQGIKRLKIWRQLTPNTQLVAIGGINDSNIQDVADTGVDGIAMISFITQSKNLTQSIALAQHACRQGELI